MCVVDACIVVADVDEYVLSVSGCCLEPPMYVNEAFVMTASSP